MVAYVSSFSDQTSATDASATAPAKPSENVEPQPASEVNGHSDKPPATNEHAESKPMNGSDSPSVPTQQPSADEGTNPPKAENAPSQEAQSGDQSSKEQAEEQTTEPANKSDQVKSDDSGNQDNKPTENAQQSTPAPNPPSEPQDVKMEEAPKTSDDSPAKAEPTPAAADTQPDVKPAQDTNSSEPSAPVPETKELEMRDAPAASPPKVSREREEEAEGEEPAAKRAKVEEEASTTADVKPETKPEPQSQEKTETEEKAEEKTEEKPDSAAPAAPAVPATAETPGTTPATTAAAANGEQMTKVQHKFLMKSMQALKRMQDARFYREPVDPVKLMIPQYFNVIKNPMDLGTIERKLKSEQYPTVKGVVDDLNLMVDNAVLFNGAQHIVAQEGLKLKATFEKQMSNLPKPDVVEEKKPKKAKQPPPPRRESRGSQANAQQATTGASPQGTTFALGPEGLPLIRRDSTTADGRPKRSIHPPKRDLPYSTKPKKKKYQWELKFCQETLDELHKPKHYSFAMPFYYPVDPVALNIPTYHSIIKKPMDLSTMQTKLKTGQYENAKEFEADMRLMFKNCYKFNIIGDPTYVAGQQLEELFDKKWSQKGRYLEVHDPQPGPQPNSSDEDNSEEPESDSDNKVVSLLQKQIAEMSRQVDAIQKKKTPPSTKKASKAKSSKKESTNKGGGGGSKEKKSSTSKSKSEKPRWVTYQEKQQISNGISNLPDKKMQEALRIIQNNVPALKVCLIWEGCFIVMNLSD